MFLDSWMTINKCLFASLLFILSSAVYAEDDASSAAAARAPYQVPELRLYGHLPAIDITALSESGRQLAMVVSVDDRRLLVVGDAGKQLTLKIGLGDI